MHLLSVNLDFRYDPIYALGVVTTFDRFMQGYRPEVDKEPIFAAICQAVGDDPQKFKQDAERLKSLAGDRSVEQLIDSLSQPSPSSDLGELSASLVAIINNPKLKYSRLFAVGLLSLLEQANPEVTKDTKQLTQALKQIAAGLHLPEDKLLKDLELYRSNLEKMDQALVIMEDAVKAERKKREQRATEKGLKL